MSNMGEPFEVLSNELLALVAGGDDPGYQPQQNGLGRVGPGMSWSWLGDYYTPEALRHDTAVRDGIQQGYRPWVAHLRAAGSLLPAIASYPRARWFPGPNDRHIPRQP